MLVNGAWHTYLKEESKTSVDDSAKESIEPGETVAGTRTNDWE